MTTETLVQETFETGVERELVNELKRIERQNRRDSIGRAWYKFSSNKLSIVGLIMVTTVILLAIFAPYVAPFPKHVKPFTDFVNAKSPPTAQNILGTDQFGRDILSRVIFGFRFSLMMGVVVLAIVVPIGVTLGMIAGYFQGRFIDAAIMRLTDIFLSVPPLILALAIASVGEPNLPKSMVAVSAMWWPWYARLVYGLSSALRTEYFVSSAETIGGSTWHILFREILPNMISPILTKMSLDMGWVIIIGSMLSFLGLGVQEPDPGLGTMVSKGSDYLSTGQWWISIFPALAIVVVVLGFNLLGDGIRDLLSAEEV